MLARLITNHSRSYVSRSPKIEKKQSLLMKTITKDFKTYFPKIIDNGVANATFVDTKEMKDRIKMFSEYYTAELYPVQGEFLISAYEAIQKPKSVSDEFVHKMQVIVSTMEMIQFSACFWDDFDDSATVRLGKPCWHLLDGNGSLALIDANVMRCFIDEIVRQNFKGQLRDQILDIYNRVNFLGNVGQIYDKLQCQSKDYDQFTMEQYNITNKYKASYHSVKAPVLLALILSNKLDEESYRIVDHVFTEIGSMTQIHNDLMDYYNTIDSLKGKSGSDIQEGKCSWVATVVLQNCNPEQRRVFVENYGSWEPQKVNRILQLYKEMDIPKLYEQEQLARYDVFHNKVNELPENSTPSIEFLNGYFKLLRQYIQDTSDYMYNKD